MLGLLIANLILTSLLFLAVVGAAVWGFVKMRKAKARLANVGKIAGAFLAAAKVRQEQQA